MWCRAITIPMPRPCRVLARVVSCRFFMVDMESMFTCSMQRLFLCVFNSFHDIYIFILWQYNSHTLSRIPY